MSDEKPTKLGMKNNREQNEVVLREALNNNEEINKLRENFKGITGYDMLDSKNFPVTDRKFSWKKMRAKLQEADSASNFSQVLRAGVQTVVNAAYQSVPTTFEDWVHVIQSTKDTELYAPLHGISFAREIGRQEKYSESRSAGLDIKLKNRKYGQIWPVELELFDDDQTGQFQRQVGYIGEYLKLVLEVLSYAKLASSSSTMQYADLVVPKSETQPADESVYPWSNTLVGGGKTRLTTFALLTQSSIQTAYQVLLKQKNLLGLQMMVRPSRIISGPRYQFDAAVLLHSSYYPTGATSGTTGGAFSINPLKGIADHTVSRFIFRPDTGALDDGFQTPWWLVDDNVPWFICQVREGAVVQQENPASGESFDRDVVRYKGRTRANADFIDPRFACLGNDGSV